MGKLGRRIQRGPITVHHGPGVRTTYDPESGQGCSFVEFPEDATPEQRAEIMRYAAGEDAPGASPWKAKLPPELQDLQIIRTDPQRCKQVSTGCEIVVDPEAYAILEYLQGVDQTGGTITPEVRIALEYLRDNHPQVLRFYTGQDVSAES